MKKMTHEKRKRQEYRDNERRKELGVREKIKRQVDDFLMSEAEVRAQLGGICRQTMYVLQKSGRFPAAMMIGSKKFWRHSVVVNWLEAQQPLAA
jgi:predicted DNA-binding transcriptional regulator AlpA